MSKLYKVAVATKACSPPKYASWQKWDCDKYGIIL